VQVRVNLETVGADGQAAPASGTLTAFAPPTGPGVRVDTHGRPGHRAGDGFDPLLAKVVAHAPRGTFAEAADRAERALAEFQVEGADTSLPLLRAVLRHPGFRAGGYPTSFLADHFGELAAEAGLDAGGAPPDGGEGLVAAPFAGTVVAVEAAPGDPVRAGAPLVVIEAMKMEHVLPAPAGGAEAEPEADPAEIRPDLAEVIERHEIGLDARRPGAVERRRA